MTEHNHHVDVVKLNHLGEEVWRYPGEVIKTDEKGVLVKPLQHRRSSLSRHHLTRG